MSTIQKIALRGVLVILLAGTFAVTAFRENAITHLRAEHQTLLDQTQEARQLEELNRELATLRETNAEVVKLREENQDLPKLRNEARQLRRQTDEFARLRAENDQLQAKLASVQNQKKPREIPPDVISRAMLRDVGLSTPEATAETLFCAMCQGNLERMNQLVVKENLGQAGNLEEEKNHLIEQMKGFNGYRIADKKIIADDLVELTFQAPGGVESHSVRMQKVGNEWKIATFF